MEGRRLSWKRCFLCSAPVTNIPCKNDQRSKASFNLFVKYLLCDFKLEKTLSQDFLQCVKNQLISENPFCIICEEFTDCVLRLQLELEKIQMKIVDKVITMRKIVISNSRLYGDNIEVKTDWDIFEDRLRQKKITGEEVKDEERFLEMMHVFQSSIFESDGKHPLIPLVYLKKLTGEKDWTSIAVGVTEELNLEIANDQSKIKNEPTIKYDNDNDDDEDFFPQNSLFEESDEDLDEEYIPTVKVTKHKGRLRKPPSDPLTELPPKKPKGRPRIHPPKQPKPPKPPPPPKQKICLKAKKLKKEMEQEDASNRRKLGRQPILQCDVCDYNTTSGFNMTTHLKKRHETSEKNHKCPECEKAFTQRLSLKLHLLHHLRTEPCDICKIRVVPSEMETHLKTHSDKVFSCSYCVKCFGDFRNLMYHRLSIPRHHPSTESLKCGLCSSLEAMEYDFKTELSQHLREVHGLANIDFKCDAQNCSKAFPCPKDLSVHQRWHKNKNACPHCEKGFIQRFALDKHVQKHHRLETEKKTKLRKGPVSCNICSEKFSRDHNLARHKILAHNFPKYKCDICPDKEFTSSSGQRYHLRAFHNVGKKISSKKCPYCDFVCIGVSRLKVHVGQHMITKEFTCEVCGFATKTSEYLRRHKATHLAEEDKHECSLCQRKFPRKGYLKDHMRTHTKEKPYVCEICGAAFTMKSNLNSHKKAHQKLAHGGESKKVTG